jgi:hypothetical protein
MKIKQISLFVENKIGALKLPCKLLAENKINIFTLSLADTENFGIMRIIVDDWEKAIKLLEKARFTVKVTDVVAVGVEDRPGGLSEILDVLDRENVNVEYMYAFTSGHNDSAVMIFRFEKTDDAVKALQKHGVKTISRAELFVNRKHPRFTGASSHSKDASAP